jgi:hypothetical protein
MFSRVTHDRMALVSASESDGKDAKAGLWSLLWFPECER